jgi:hypothetical protein
MRFLRDEIIFVKVAVGRDNFNGVYKGCAFIVVFMCLIMLCQMRGAIGALK